MVYRIELPLVTRAAQVVLDVAERQLSLSYLDTYSLLRQGFQMLDSDSPR